jgi:hypothetical protein
MWSSAWNRAVRTPILNPDALNVPVSSQLQRIGNGMMRARNNLWQDQFGGEIETITIGLWAGPAP